VQARVLPIADRHRDYAEQVAESLRAAGVRADVDSRSESVGRKIRDAELAKVPYMAVVGDNESAQAGVSLRRHREGDLGLMPLDRAADRIASDRN
jgi:threonyl-tRNA synthetase